MSIAEILSKYRRGRTLRLWDDTEGTIDGTALRSETWGYNPRRYALVLDLKVREIVNGRYTGRTCIVDCRNATVAS